MNAANEIETAVQRVPIWGWGALGAGVLVIYMAKRNAATKAAATDPNAGVQYGVSPIPDYNTAPVTPGVTPDPMSSPFSSSLPLIQSQSAAGSATYAPATYTERFQDIIGGNLADFANQLRNAPNELDLTLPGGVSFTSRNDVPTYGGGQGTPLNAPSWLQALGQSIMKLQPGEGWYNPATATYLAPSSGGASSYTPPTQSASPASTPSTSCNLGNYSCIRYACPPGDAACAKGVAPWWRGDPIGGWSAGY